MIKIRPDGTHNDLQYWNYEENENKDEQWYWDSINPGEHHISDHAPPTSMEDIGIGMVLTMKVKAVIDHVVVGVVGEEGHYTIIGNVYCKNEDRSQPSY